MDFWLTWFTRMIKAEGKRKGQKCLVFEEKVDCDNKNELLEIFVNNEQRIKILIDLSLFIKLCHTFQINFEDELTERDKKLIEGEMNLIRNNVHILGHKERMILLKHCPQAYCQACWEDLCTANRLTLSFLPNYTVNSIKELVKQLIKFIISIIKEVM